MSVTNREMLTAGLVRCMDDFLPKLTKHTIMIYSNRDMDAANAILNEWVSRGRLTILKPLEIADENDFVIEFEKNQPKGKI